MAFAINTLIQEACELVSLVGMGEAVDGTTANAAVAQLNRAISQLNSQDYICGAVKYVDAPSATTIRIYDGEGADISMDAPEKVTGVSRLIGNRFIRLVASDPQTIYAQTRQGVAQMWCYDIEPATVNGETKLVGTITLDGNPNGSVRIFYNSAIPTYKLTDKCYLGDIYRDMLTNALACNLCDLFKLDSYKQRFADRLEESKKLIRRDRLNGRMLTNGGSVGSYLDEYFDGVAGRGW